jgi:hypothetical protein
MQQCSKCQGLVPDSVESCPNCRSTRRWWAIPLSLLGASAASVTLSACYGAPCATKLPDGTFNYGNANCIAYDCTADLPDGGVKAKDPQWVALCTDGTTDGGADGGH